ncbi:MAG: glycosidase [Ruminococcaceae bacterium]|nr:glycosidase [Oscillospiraceae bacterium]
MKILTPELRTSPVVTKLEKPLLTRHDIPYESSLVFNAGVVKYHGQYVMVFRNDYGPVNQQEYEEKRTKPVPMFDTHLGIAFSDDGINWKVNEKPFMHQDDVKTDEIRRFYDPRLTIIDDELYMCFAVDTKHGILGGIGRIHNLERLEILSLSTPDNRNMVLFPEKINGMYVRLERPFPVYGRGGKDRFDMWISQSPDLKFWGNSQLLMGVEDVPYANDKIGPAAPPVRTDKGWLTTFHAVDIDPERGKNGWATAWKKRYCAGIMLLDLENPYKIIGYSKQPLIAPDTEYETSDEGFRGQVIFPGGMILEDNGEVKIYYGAADTVECLATANVNDLIALCTETK